MDCNREPLVDPPDAAALAAMSFELRYLAQDEDGAEEARNMRLEAAIYGAASSLTQAIDGLATAVRALDRSGEGKATQPAKFEAMIVPNLMQELGLTARAYGALFRAGVHTVEDLRRFIGGPLGTKPLSRLSNVGPKTARHVFERLLVYDHARAQADEGGEDS